MTEIKNTEEKQKVAKDIKELVDSINKIITMAPAFLEIRFQQNIGFNHGVNAFLNVWIEEKISYP